MVTISLDNASAGQRAHLARLEREAARRQRQAETPNASMYAKEMAARAAVAVEDYRKEIDGTYDGFRPPQ